MLSNQNRASFQRGLLHWYNHNRRDLPWRRTRDPYAILVSEFMLQQTQVATVIGFYENWLKRFPTVSTLAEASETAVLHAWQGLGYYTRARNLHAAAKRVVHQHAGVIPKDPEDLRKLPGMGRYTANAVASFAFDRSVPIVEANTARVLARLFNVRVPIDSSAGRERLWERSATLVPKNNAGRFNSALMDLGALVCIRSNPRCNICPVKTFCRADRPALLPIKKARPRIVRAIESHGFVRRGNDLLLQHCSNRWRGMWMLPALPSRERRSLRPIHSSVFPFTHHQITLRVFRAQRVGTLTAGQRWVAIDDLDTIPIPSPHRRAITALLRSSH